MPLLNYTTSVPADKTAHDILGLLAKKGAKAVLIEYDAGGSVVAVSFKVDTPHGSLPIRLPIDVEACQKVLYRQYTQRTGVTYRQTQMDHARKVAWRIVKDWLEAQIAILDTEMVKMEQIFLPYMQVSPDKTLYEHMVEGGFKALSSGQRPEE